MPKPKKHTYFSCPVLLILLFVIFLPFISYAQNNIKLDTLSIYKKTANVPKSIALDPASLAQYLTKDYDNEAEKVLAISYWISKNIKYNYKAFKDRVILSNSSDVVLKKGKALCGEYATLFKEMCAVVGIEAEVVRGYTQGFDFFETDTLYRDEHAWSIVKINNEWTLMDLTYGSGHVEQKKQPIKKFLAKTLGIKYVPKFKYVHAFNPRWYYVKPDEMIFTHFPNLNMFQLLKVPLPHKLYKQGGWLIYGHLSWYYKTLKQSEAIDAYQKMSPIEQIVFEAEEGHKVNPQNHRIKGIHYYLALNELFQAHFDKEHHVLNVSPNVLAQMDSFAAIADAFLKESIVDNEKEYRDKQVKSMAWKDRLNKQNKLHIQKLEERERLNQKQERLVHKIEKNHNASQSFVTQHAQHFKESIILRTERPLSPDLEDEQMSLSLISQIDSLQRFAAIIINQKDSFIRGYADGAGHRVNRREELVMKIHRGNSNALKLHFKEKKATLPFVYEDIDFLDKMWFWNSHHRADSINLVVTDTFLVSLHKDQLAAQQLVKNYYETIRQQLKLIRKVKSKSIQNLREDNRYLEAIGGLEKQFELYKEELQNCMSFQKKLIQFLSKEIQYMKNSKKTLSQDDLLENYRHVEYMEYRNYIKTAENSKMQSILKKVSKIKAYIDQAQSK